MNKLETTYKILCETPSDINEHLKTLREYASKCSSVCELGTRNVVSAVALAGGLADSEYPNKKLYLFDIIPEINLERIEEGCFEKGIDIIDTFGMNDLDADITGDEYDLLFIDSAHNYVHCYEELCKFGKQTNKYILFHDTQIDGITSEYVRLRYESQHYQYFVNYYKNKYTEEEFKQGLKFAIDRFITENPEWSVEKVYENNNGLTILKKD